MGNGWQEVPPDEFMGTGSGVIHGTVHSVKVPVCMCCHLGRSSKSCLNTHLTLSACRQQQKILMHMSFMYSTD